MAIAYVQSASATGFGTSVNVVFGTNNTAGNMLAIVGNRTGDITGVTDTNNTPAKALDAANAGSFIFLDIWYVENCGAGANTVNIAGAGSENHAAAVAEYSGIATSSSLDKTSTSQGFGTAADSGTTTTLAQADELCIGAVGEANVKTHVWTGSFTERQDVSNANAATLADLIVAATTGIAATATVSASADWVASIATFKASAAAAGGYPILYNYEVEPVSAIWNLGGLI